MLFLWSDSHLLSRPIRLACGACGTPLEEAPDTPFVDRVPCPKCGSTIRTHNEPVTEKLTAREGYGFKHKRPGFKKPLAEGFKGWQPRKSVGDLVYKEQRIDREKDHYRERVETERGELINESDEPLSEHRGHGSAKPKLRKTKNGPPNEGRDK